MPNIVKPMGVNQLWAAGGTRVDPGLAKSNIGWVVELPPYQYANWLEHRQDTFIAHVNQHGIPEWDAETEYQGNLSYTQGTDGIIYKCIQTHINQNPTNPVNSLYWSRAFETFGSVAVVQNQLTQHIANYQVLSGLTNLALARSNLSVYSRAESDVRYAATLGNSGNKFAVADATDPSHAVPLGQLNSLLLGATESTSGVISIATVGEVEQGTNDSKAISPAKGSAVFLKKSQNLADVPNKPLARTNLGLTSMATANPASFLQAANNLSDVVNVSLARTNLGLGSAATTAITDYLRTANNLSDLSSPATARNNLGLTSLATQDPNSVLLKANNLSGLTNPATARANLGLADSATLGSGTWLKTNSNLADIPNKQAARNNLGLGGAAVMDVFGAEGVLDFTATKGNNGQYVLPNGIIEKWGRINIGADSSVNLVFPTPFAEDCYNFTWTLQAGYNQNSTGLMSFNNLSRTGCTIYNGENNSGIVHWRAIGV